MPKPTDDDKKPDFLTANDDNDGDDALPQAPNNPEPEVQAAPEAPVTTPDPEADMGAAADAAPSPDAGEVGDAMPPWAEKFAMMISEGFEAAFQRHGDAAKMEQAEEKPEAPAAPAPPGAEPAAPPAPPGAEAELGAAGPEAAPPGAAGPEAAKMEGDEEVAVEVNTDEDAAPEVSVKPVNDPTTDEDPDAEKLAAMSQDSMSDETAVEEPNASASEGKATEPTPGGTAAGIEEDAAKKTPGTDGTSESPSLTAATPRIVGTEQPAPSVTNLLDAGRDKPDLTKGAVSEEEEAASEPRGQEAALPSFVDPTIEDGTQASFAGRGGADAFLARVEQQVEAKFATMIASRDGEIAGLKATVAAGLQEKAEDTMLKAALRELRHVALDEDTVAGLKLQAGCGQVALDSFVAGIKRYAPVDPDPTLESFTAVSAADQEPDAVAQFAARGPGPHSMAMKLSKQWEANRKSGLVSMTLERYLACNNDVILAETGK